MKKVELLIKPKQKKVEVKTSVKPILQKKQIKLVQPPKPVLQKKVKEELPADVYKPVGTPSSMTIAVKEDKGVEFKIFVSVNRQGDKGLPLVDIREHITSPKFTGFTQKGVVVPLQLYPQFVDMLLKTLNQQEVQKALRDLKLAEKED